MAEPSKVSFQVHDGGQEDWTPNTESLTRNISFSSGGGDGGGSGMDAETYRFVEAKVDSVKAQNDARFAEVLTRLDQMPKFWPSVIALVVTVFGAVGGVFAVLAYASDRFDSGVNSMGAIEGHLNAQREINVDQNARIDRIISTLEELNSEAQE